MLNKCANSMADLLSKNHIVDEKDKDIYVYGIEVILSTAINLFIIIIMGIILGLLAETLVFIVCFASLRVYAGGYHAKTHLGCICAFTTVYLANMAIQHFTPIDLKGLLAAIIGTLSCLYVWVVAPIEHENRMFEGNEYRQFKKISRLVVTSESVIIIAALLISPLYRHFSYSVALAMLSVVFVLALAKKIKVRGG